MAPKRKGHCQREQSIQNNEALGTNLRADFSKDAIHHLRKEANDAGHSIPLYKTTRKQRTENEKRQTKRSTFETNESNATDSGDTMGHRDQLDNVHELSTRQSLRAPQ